MRQRTFRDRWLGRAAIVAMAASVALTFPAVAAPLPGEQPYDEQLLRLSELLGALHYLRPLCGSNEGQIWRDKMNALIAAEEPSPERKKRLIDRFNRSFNSLAEVYKTCTPAATEVVERSAREGAKLTRDMVTRYGRQ